MVISPIYVNETEKRDHINAVQKLANDLGVSTNTVNSLYEKELKRLQEIATVKSFISVFVSRRVKNIIKNQYFQ